jgi:hypothetical protein
MHPADPLGSLTPAEAPLIEAEKLSEQAGPPQAAVCDADACITAVDPIGIWNNRWVDRGNFGARERLGS